MRTRADLLVSLQRLATPVLAAMLNPVNADGYTDLARDVARELLVARGVDPQDVRIPPCPGCGHPLDPELGDLESRTGFLAFLLVGIGYQPTWFTSRSSGAREVVLRPRMKRAAARCQRCGLVMFMGRS